MEKPRVRVSQHSDELFIPHERLIRGSNFPELSPGLGKTFNVVRDGFVFLMRKRIAHGGISRSTFQLTHANHNLNTSSEL